MAKYRSIDLFAGIGGIRLGFDNAFGKDVETVFVSDIFGNGALEDYLLSGFYVIERTGKRYRLSVSVGIDSLPTGICFQSFGHG